MAPQRNTLRAVRVNFEIDYTNDKLKSPYMLAVIGSIEALGKWDTDSCVPAKRDDSGKWVVDVELPKHNMFEWRWIVVSQDDKSVILARECGTRKATIGHYGCSYIVPKWGESEEVVVTFPNRDDSETAVDQSFVDKRPSAEIGWKRASEPPSGDLAEVPDSVHTKHENNSPVPKVAPKPKKKPFHDAQNDKQSQSAINMSSTENKADTTTNLHHKLESNRSPEKITQSCSAPLPDRPIATDAQSVNSNNAEKEYTTTESEKKSDSENTSQSTGLDQSEDVLEEKVSTCATLDDPPIIENNDTKDNLSSKSQKSVDHTASVSDKIEMFNGFHVTDVQSPEMSKIEVIEDLALQKSATDEKKTDETDCLDKFANISPLAEKEDTTARTVTPVPVKEDIPIDIKNPEPDVKDITTEKCEPLPEVRYTIAETDKSSPELEETITERPIRENDKPVKGEISLVIRKSDVSTDPKETTDLQNDQESRVESGLQSHDDKGYVFESEINAISTYGPKKTLETQADEERIKKDVPTVLDTVVSTKTYVEKDSVSHIKTSEELNENLISDSRDNMVSLAYDIVNVSHTSVPNNEKEIHFLGESESADDNFLDDKKSISKVKSTESTKLSTHKSYEPITRDYLRRNKASTERVEITNVDIDPSLSRSLTEKPSAAFSKKSLSVNTDDEFSYKYRNKEKESLLLTKKSSSFKEPDEKPVPKKTLSFDRDDIPKRDAKSSIVSNIKQTGSEIVDAKPPICNLPLSHPSVFARSIDDVLAKAEKVLSQATQVISAAEANKVAQVSRFCNVDSPSSFVTNSGGQTKSRETEIVSDRQTKIETIDICSQSKIPDTISTNTLSHTSSKYSVSSDSKTTKIKTNISFFEKENTKTIPSDKELDQNKTPENVDTKHTRSFSNKTVNSDNVNVRKENDRNKISTTTNVTYLYSPKPFAKPELQPEKRNNEVIKCESELPNDTSSKTDPSPQKVNYLITEFTKLEEERNKKVYENNENKPIANSLQKNNTLQSHTKSNKTNTPYGVHVNKASAAYEGKIKNMAKPELAMSKISKESSELQKVAAPDKGQKQIETDREIVDVKKCDKKMVLDKKHAKHDSANNTKSHGYFKWCIPSTKHEESYVRSEKAEKNVKAQNHSKQKVVSPLTTDLRTKYDIGEESEDITTEQIDEEFEENYVNAKYRETCRQACLESTKVKGRVRSVSSGTSAKKTNLKQNAEKEAIKQLPLVGSAKSYKSSKYGKSYKNDSDDDDETTAKKYRPFKEFVDVGKTLRDDNIIEINCGTPINENLQSGTDNDRGSITSSDSLKRSSSGKRIKNETEVYIPPNREPRATLSYSSLKKEVLKLEKVKQHCISELKQTYCFVEDGDICTGEQRESDAENAAAGEEKEPKIDDECDSTMANSDTTEFQPTAFSDKIKNKFDAVVFNPVESNHPYSKNEYKDEKLSTQMVDYNSAEEYYDGQYYRDEVKYTNAKYVTPGFDKYSEKASKINQSLRNNRVFDNAKTYEYETKNMNYVATPAHQQYEDDSAKPESVDDMYYRDKNGELVNSTTGLVVRKHSKSYENQDDEFNIPSRPMDITRSLTNDRDIQLDDKATENSDVWRTEQPYDMPIKYNQKVAREPKMSAKREAKSKAHREESVKKPQREDSHRLCDEFVDDHQQSIPENGPHSNKSTSKSKFDGNYVDDSKQTINNKSNEDDNQVLIVEMDSEDNQDSQDVIDDSMDSDDRRLDVNSILSTNSLSSSKNSETKKSGYKNLKKSKTNSDSFSENDEAGELSEEPKRNSVNEKRKIIAKKLRESKKEPYKNRDKLEEKRQRHEVQSMENDDKDPVVSVDHDVGLPKKKSIIKKGKKSKQASFSVDFSDADIDDINLCEQDLLLSANDDNLHLKSPFFNELLISHDKQSELVDLGEMDDANEIIKQLAVDDVVDIQDVFENNVENAGIAEAEAAEETNERGDDNAAIQQQQQQQQKVTYTDGGDEEWSMGFGKNGLFSFLGVHINPYRNF